MPKYRFLVGNQKRGFEMSGIQLPDDDTVEELVRGLRAPGERKPPAGGRVTQSQVIGRANAQSATATYGCGPRDLH